MAAFFTDLAMSIFTPGPTPTLLVATNATFAALQVVLALLLIATYSVHFIVLSLLSAGLWWSINWFAAEVRAGQAAEEERLRKLAEEQGEDTETEAETVIEATGEGSKEVEVQKVTGELRDRLAADRRETSGHGTGSKSEVSTEDEWERVSENEKDK
jgi:hypothetical protein